MGDAGISDALDSGTRKFHSLLRPKIAYVDPHGVRGSSLVHSRGIHQLWSLAQHLERYHRGYRELINLDVRMWAAFRVGDYKTGLTILIGYARGKPLRLRDAFSANVAGNVSQAYVNNLGPEAGLRPGASGRP